MIKANQVHFLWEKDGENFKSENIVVLTSETNKSLDSKGTCDTPAEKRAVKTLSEDKGTKAKNTTSYGNTFVTNILLA
ncbi:hypothetical protein MHH33_07710 [Paenisporosarcina sp. FSL H8-0542]|uniref:hypothetical protein n=1 Tax=Paenisporosarcina sp. FSL H8-0542 TaxID=2921401 RepID=UPI00315A63B4